MGIRKVTVKKSAAESIAAIALYIESKGMVATAEKFQIRFMIIFSNLLIQESLILFEESLYGHHSGINASLSKKKYTIVIIESETELIISEFVSSKLIHW